MSQPLNTAPKRPGLVTFAAVMLFVLGLLCRVAFMKFFNAAWPLFSPYNGVGGWLWLWGILDAIMF